MTYDEYVTDRERRIARWLAVGMHIAVVLLLIFGVTWQRRHSEPAAVVDLWPSVTPPRQEVPKPAPRVEVKPEPRRPEPPPPPPPPKVEPKPVPKPDIALKEKLERERKAREEKERQAREEQERKAREEKERERKKALEEQKRKEEEAKKLKAQRELEAKKRELEKQKLEKERLAKEAEAKRLEQEQADMKARLAREQAAAHDRIRSEYMTMISNKVKRNLVQPANVPPTASVDFDVRLLPGGEVLDVRVSRSSGIPAYDDAVARAIHKSSPLPVPSGANFEIFRHFTLRHRPE